MYSLSPEPVRGPLIASSVLTILATGATIMRLLSRRYNGIKIGVDDYLIVAAVVVIQATLGIEYACAIIGGTGRHVNTIDASSLKITLQLLIPYEVLYGVALMFVKLGTLQFYLRIFGADRTFRICTYLLMGITIAWAISVLLEAMFLCVPIARNWDLTVKGECGDRIKVFISAGSINIISDFMIICLPVWNLYKLQLPLKKRFGLMLIFSLGIFIMTASGLRIRSLQEINFDDPTFSLPMPMMWSTVEPALCVINTNLPMVRPFMRPFVSSVRGRCFGYEIQEMETTQSGTRKSNPAIPLSPWQGVSSVNRVGTQELSNNVHFPIGRNDYGVDSEIGVEEHPVGILVRREWNVHH